MDEHTHDGDHEGHTDHHADDEEARVTSPMQEFSMGQVTTGLLVTIIGLAVVFGLAFLMA